MEVVYNTGMRCLISPSLSLSLLLTHTLSLFLSSLPSPLRFISFSSLASFHPSPLSLSLSLPPSSNPTIIVLHYPASPYPSVAMTTQHLTSPLHPKVAVTMALSALVVQPIRFVAVAYQTIPIRGNHRWSGRHLMVSFMKSIVRRSPLPCSFTEVLQITYNRRTYWVSYMKLRYCVWYTLVGSFYRIIYFFFPLQLVSITLVVVR